MKKVTVTYFSFVLILLFGLLIAEAETGKVLRVIDGDTCLLEDGRKIRYLGIDAPEEGDYQYQEAALANNKLVGGKEIKFEISRPKKDRDGRLLAYVFAGDTFVNKELIHQGYAHLRRPLPAKYKELFFKTQEEAREAGRGIWIKAEGKNIVIKNTHADAKGDDRKNLNDEYIVFKNRGNTNIDMTGWMVLDEANHRYLFPNFNLPPNAEVTLRSGLGKNTEKEIFWGSRRAIWNNDGDTIIIKDSEGKYILSLIY